MDLLSPPQCQRRPKAGGEGEETERPGTASEELGLHQVQDTRPHAATRVTGYPTGTGPLM